jgi:cytochrome c oxidase subunit 3
MNNGPTSPSGPSQLSRKAPAIPSGVLAMIVFVAIEIMMFSGLISAFIITREGATGGVWPPPGQPRLPIEETAINTAALLLSGATLFWAERSFRKTAAQAAWPLFITLLLGVFFIGAQGREWVALIDQGLTLVSSAYGGFFYLIVGMHGLHAIAALLALVWAWVGLKRGRLKDTEFWAVQVFWYFVVGLWPLLYWLVYL